MPDSPLVSRRTVLTAGVAMAGAAGLAAATPRALAAPVDAPSAADLPADAASPGVATNLVSRNTASSDHIVFPADTYADQNTVAGRPYGFGVLDVRAFGAVGDGVTDDSDAIRAAINAVIDDVRAVRVNGGTSDPLASQRIIYFPNGTYLVSKILVYSAPWFDNHGGNDGTYEGLSWLRFRGESQAGAVIKLVDSATAYNNASKPRPLISFSRSLLDGKSPKNNVPGSNFVENLTIDVGSNNPGAVGLLFEGANNGALRNVTIRSTGANPGGAIGLWLPIEVTQFYGYNIDISGFNTGVSAESTEAAQISLEKIFVTDYTTCAVSVTGSCVSLKGLTSSGPGPGVVVADRADGKQNLGVASMLGCSLTGPGGTNSVPAVDLQSGGLHTRNQTVSGFGISIKNPQRGNVTGNITEYVSDDVVTVRTTDESSLGLWIDQTPLPAWDDNLDDWHSVNAEGAVGDGYLTSTVASNGYELVYTNNGTDDSDAIQNAMDSGKPIIYFRPGRTYLINKTITIPSSVQRINFMFAQIVVGADLIQDPGNTGVWQEDGHSGQPPQPSTAVQDEYSVFSVKGSSADAPLLIEDGFHQVVQGRYRFISHDSTRTLIVSDLHVSRGGLYRNRPHGARVYLENVSNRSGKYHEGNPGFKFAGDDTYPQLVWARHINAEHGDPEIVVNNAVLWALGIKKEDVGTMIECKNGGQVEIINAVAYNSGATIDPDTPLVLNEDSSVACTAAASYPHRNLDGLTPPFDWTAWITETMDGTSLESHGSDLPVRGTAQTYPDPTMRRLMLYVGRPSV